MEGLRSHDGRFVKQTSPSKGVEEGREKENGSSGEEGIYAFAPTTKQIEPPKLSAITSL
jgi:hypothetical protein